MQSAMRHFAVGIIAIFFVAIASLSFVSAAHAQSSKQPPDKSAVSNDEKIDQSMDAFADFDLLRLRAAPPERKGPGLYPPFNQLPPNAQKNFEKPPKLQ